MKLVIDDKIPVIRDTLSKLFDIHPFNKQTLTQELLHDADVLLVRTVSRINADWLANSKVQFVGTASAGFDHIDTDYCEQNHIAWHHAPGNNALAVSDYVMACLANAEQQNLLHGNKAAVIGAGHVGRLVSKRLSAAGFTVYQNDPPREIAETNFISTPLEECLQADVICLHTPLTEQGDFPSKYLINQENISRLKNRAILINAARGGVIEEQALSLRSDLTYCLDVWENEPHINESLLQNVFIGTPHIAGYSKLAKIRAALMLLEQLKQHFNLNITLPDIHTFEGTSSQSILNICNPLKLTQQLREQGFLHLRQHYPLRDESR